MTFLENLKKKTKNYPQTTQKIKNKKQKMSHKDASNQKCSENIIYLEWKNIKNDIFIKLKTNTRMTQNTQKLKYQKIQKDMEGGLK